MNKVFKYTCFLSFFIVYLINPAIARSLEDENIVILSKKEMYEYKLGDKKHPVVVKSAINTVFQCNKYRAVLPFAEIYNDMLTIDKVNISKRGIYPYYGSIERDGIFYSDAKICAFRIPFTKKGETCTVNIQQTFLDPRYFTVIFFHESEFIVEKEIKIIVPAWMNVELREWNFEGNNITKNVFYDNKLKANIYVYIIKDMPAVKIETNVQGPAYIHPHIMLLNKSADIAIGRQTYFSTLADLYAWYRSIVNTVNIDVPLMKETALRLTENCITDTDKIKKIFHWVQDNIRYIAFEDAVAGFKPAAPQDVLSKKYGDCKGMALLMRELLKALGFDARLAWLGTNYIAYDYSTPSMAVDNHVVCALLLNNEIYYLDATEKYIGFDEYAQRIQGRQTLIEDGSNYILERIPERTAEQNTAMEKSVFQIKDGMLVGNIEIIFQGEEKTTFLNKIHSVRKEKLKDKLTNYLSKGNAQYSISGLSYTSLEAISETTSLSYTVQTKIGIQQYGREYYVDLDFRKEFMNSQIDTVKRVHDFLFPYKFHVCQQAELGIPANMKVAGLPENLLIVRDGYRFDISYTYEDGKVVYRKEMIMNTTLLPKEQFTIWNRDIGLLKKAYGSQMSLIEK